MKHKSARRIAGALAFFLAGTTLGLSEFGLFILAYGLLCGLLMAL